MKPVLTDYFLDTAFYPNTYSILSTCHTSMTETHTEHLSCQYDRSTYILLLECLVLKKKKNYAHKKLPVLNNTHHINNIELVHGLG